MQAVEELIQALPGSVKRLELVDEPPSGIRYVDDADENFVPPDLTLVAGGVSLEDAALILISAPAAVGKSMLARALAQATGGVLWDLGAFQVGSNFLVGTIGSSHGYAMTGAVTNALGSGDFLIVMDALDEATVKAGLANLEAFASDLATVLTGLNPPRPAVVLLGRAEKAELAQLILEESDLPIAHFTISYFDRAKAEQFIDLKLDQRGVSGHRAHRAAFEQARNLLFDRVFQVLGVPSDSWDEPEARGFLGYAPVLEALAEYLSASNYAALVNEIEQSVKPASAAQSETIWQFLIRIIEDVLEREQQKLATSLPDELAARIDAAGRLDGVYTPSEQCARLVARVVRRDPPDPGLPSELRGEYEEVVAQFVSEHPFVGRGDAEFANVVFRDYIFARALVGAAAAEREDVRSYVAEASFRPSPLLARFLLELMPEDHQLGIADFGIVYDSLRAEDAADQSSSLSVAEENGHVAAQFISATGEHLDLQLAVGDGDELHVWGRIANAIVDLERVPIVLGRHGEPFTIGPSATIWAPQVRLLSSELVVDSRDVSESATAVVTDSFASEAPDPQVVQHGPQDLTLVVPHALAYPWVQFRSDKGLYKPPEPDVRPALGDLARLITWFRSEGFGGLGMYAKPLDAAAAKGRVSQPLLDYSLDRGLITREGKLYLLHPGEFGLNLTQVKAKVASEQVSAFLRDFLATQD